MIGGYSQPKKDIDGKMANLVNKKLLEIKKNLGEEINNVKILTYKQQVVNGMNYKVLMEINGKKFEVVLYEKLPCYGGDVILVSCEKVC